LDKELVDIFFEMVSIDSESGNEEEFLKYLKNLFTNQLNARCINDNYGNLLAKIPGKNTNVKDPILFGVHADTVLPGKNIVPVLKNGVIFSNGNTILGADNKAGIAELFQAIKTAHTFPPLEIVVSREEEIGLKGSKNLDFSMLESKRGFVVDSDNLEDIVIGGPGKAKIFVEIVGRAAHAGMEIEKGISSIRAAAFAISILKEGWIDKETTVNIGIINGGNVLNAVPERTNVQIECRSKSDKKCLYQSNLIRDIFLIISKNFGAHAEIKIENTHTSYKISEEAEIVKIAKRAVSKVGLNPDVKIILGGTDAINYNKNEIETVVIGTGVKKAHTKNEHIALIDMEKAVNIIKYIFEELSNVIIL
jgi:tripeptide aminopeptidase